MGDKARVRVWPVTLHQIEDLVSSHLGPGRVEGNEQGPCFSRQVSMYLARHVGRWSSPRIGRFYNGRHHTTVLHAIKKIEELRKKDEGVDALLEVLSDELSAVAMKASIRPVLSIVPVVNPILREMAAERGADLDPVRRLFAGGDWRCRIETPVSVGRARFGVRTATKGMGVALVLGTAAPPALQAARRS